MTRVGRQHVTIYKMGGSAWHHPDGFRAAFQLDQLFGNTCMFVLEVPVISFNPKAFFCDELFRLCFPKLSLISTNPGRATHSNACAGPVRSRYFLAQRSSKRKNSKPVCFFLWAAGKAGTTLRLTDVELGLEPSQGNMCSLVGWRKWWLLPLSIPQYGMLGRTEGQLGAGH